MFSAFFNCIKTIILFMIIIFLISIISFIFIKNEESYNISFSPNLSINSSLSFAWPIPGYTNISSPFGKRQSPTSGASSYHSGIDIPAPEGTKLFSIDDAYVIFASWGAGGGYTITYQLVNHPEIKVSYCHVSPAMYVSKDDKIKKNQLIGTVGPKNVYGIINNPYRDSNGNPTNGASTGCHLHFTIKLNNQAINPLNYFDL